MTNNDVLPLKRSKQVWIFVGFLLFLVLLLVVSTVVDVVMEDREQARRHLMPAFEVTRESAGEEITHAVGVAVEKYQAILDKQWTNPDCTPDHCADSTDTIPGTPPKRDRVTQEESDLLVLKTNPQKKETREEIMPDPAGPVVSNIQIYSTKKHEDGTVTAVVTVMTYGTVKRGTSPATASWRSRPAPQTRATTLLHVTSGWRQRRTNTPTPPCTPITPGITSRNVPKHS